MKKIILGRWCWWMWWIWMLSKSWFNSVKTDNYFSKLFLNLLLLFLKKTSYKAIYKLENIQKLQRGTFRYKVYTHIFNIYHILNTNLIFMLGLVWQSESIVWFGLFVIGRTQWFGRQKSVEHHCQISCKFFFMKKHFKFQRFPTKLFFFSIKRDLMKMPVLPMCAQKLPKSCRCLPTATLSNRLRGLVCSATTLSAPKSTRS